MASWRLAEIHGGAKREATRSHRAGHSQPRHSGSSNHRGGRRLATSRLLVSVGTPQPVRDVRDDALLVVVRLVQPQPREVLEHDVVLVVIGVVRVLVTRPLLALALLERLLLPRVAGA